MAEVGVVDVAVDLVGHDARIGFLAAHFHGRHADAHQVIGAKQVEREAVSWRRGQYTDVYFHHGDHSNHVNRLLARYGRRLGPDPASTDIACVGGVIANNSGGMRCGVTADSYSTVSAMTLVLANGSVIDTAANTVVAAVKVGNLPKFVAVTPDGRHVYVPNQGSGTVSVIDTATNAVAATVPAIDGATGVAITRDGKRAYVTSANAPGSVFVINTATNRVVATVPVGNDPLAVAISPDGKQAYVANGTNGDTVSVIDTASNKVVATIPVGVTPGAIAITPDGKRAYVANGASNPGTVSVIDTANNKVIATVTVASNPTGIAVTPRRSQ